MPLEDRVPTLPRIGDIRTGEKDKTKGYPKSLRHFRFTSASKPALDYLAATYGGTVQEWEDAPTEGLYELYTKANELPVLLSRLAGFEQAYELWGKEDPDDTKSPVVCLRSCTGVVQSDGEDCVCPALADRTKEFKADPKNAGKKFCKTSTKLSVLIPGVPGLGVWRVVTHGNIAADQLSAQLTYLEDTGLMNAGVFPATLRIEAAKGAGVRYNVLKLDLDIAPEGVSVQQAIAAARHTPVVQAIEGTLQPKGVLHEPITADPNDPYGVDDQPAPVAIRPDSAYDADGVVADGEIVDAPITDRQKKHIDIVKTECIEHGAFTERAFIAKLRKDYSVNSITKLTEDHAAELIQRLQQARDKATAATAQARAKNPRTEPEIQGAFDELDRFDDSFNPFGIPDDDGGEQS